MLQNSKGKIRRVRERVYVYLFWEKRRERQLSVTHCPTTAFLRHRHCNCCCCEARCEGHHVFVCSPAWEVSITQPTSWTPNSNALCSLLLYLWIKYAAVECFLKMRKKKKKNLNVVRYWASRTGPETLRGLLRRSTCPRFFFFNISLPIDCLMIYYVFDECNHISQWIGLWGPSHMGRWFYEIII